MNLHATVPCPAPVRDVLPLLPLVRSLARRFERRWSLPAGIDHDDLVAEAVLALLLASRRFDPTRNCSFRTFGSYAARGAMLDQLRKRWTTLNREAPLADVDRAGPWLEPERLELQQEAIGALSSNLDGVEQALVTGWVGGDTLKTLGQQFGMSITTAHKHFHGAMNKVRMALGVHCNDDVQPEGCEAALA